MIKSFKTVLVQDHVYSRYLHFASANVGNQQSQNDSACAQIYAIRDDLPCPSLHFYFQQICRLGLVKI
ncbi:hypothetical protein pb186bvf_015739 [Paramecium bursaria]